MGTTEVDPQGPRIRVVGCGGAGTNVVHRLAASEARGIRTVAVNTDREHLAQTTCDTKVLLGDGAVRGTGGRPEIGARLAAVHEKEVRGAVTGGDLTFVIAGLGGGVGTGVAPLVVEWARRSGGTVVGLATMPFRTEAHRHDAARRGLAALRAACNSLVVLENDRLLRQVPDLPLEQAFAVMDHVIGEAIRGLAGAMHDRHLIQLDFPDVREILHDGGLTALLFGEGDPDRPKAILENAMKNSLLDAEVAVATGAVLHMTTGPSLPMNAVDDVVQELRRRTDRNTRIVFGVRTDPEFEGAMRVMTLLTGVRARALAEKDPLGIPAVS